MIDLILRMPLSAIANNQTILVWGDPGHGNTKSGDIGDGKGKSGFDYGPVVVVELSEAAKRLLDYK